MKGGFRHDINGLRALAVASVLLFHFGAPFSDGGFAGVDVFYVISGFLMTQIILGGFDRGDFSLWRFYANRVRRIVPALLALCIVLLSLGAILVDPLTYRDIGRNALASILFVSNFLYAQQRGYFTPEAETNWLLHTWSLSVEWQFYIVYPLVLMALRRWWSSLIGPAIVLGALLSFAATSAIAIAEPGATTLSFYLLPTRAWEMLTGGIVAVYGQGKLKPGQGAGSLLQAGGLLLIAASAVLLSGDQPWPSVWTLPPVLGAAMVIWAGRGEAAWSRLPGVQAVGLWSYSIYLWHWPIVAALRYAGIDLSAGIIGGAIVASVALGAASYGLVEVAFRRRLFEVPTLPSYALQLLLVGLVAAAGWGVFVTTGLERARMSGLPAPLQAELHDYRAAMDDWSFTSACRPVAGAPEALRLCQTGKGVSDVLVIGDSHAQQLAQRYGARADASVAFATRGGCPPLPGVGRTKASYECQAFSKAAFDYALSGGYKRVVVTAAWPSYFGVGPSATPEVVCFGPATDCQSVLTQAERRKALEAAGDRLAAQLNTLKAAGVEPVLMLDLPWAKRLHPQKAYTAAFFGATSQRGPLPLSEYEDGVQGVNAVLRGAAAEAGVQVADPVEFLCAQEQCPVEVNKRYLFKDSGHYRASVITDSRFDFLDRYLLGG